MKKIHHIARDYSLLMWKNSGMPSPFLARSHNVVLPTQLRCSDWVTTESLWKAVVRDLPGNGKGHFNYANNLASSGLYEDAARHYEASISLGNDPGASHFSLGVVKSRIGKINEAESHWMECVRECRHDDHRTLSSCNKALAIIANEKGNFSAWQAYTKAEFDALLSPYAVSDLKLPDIDRIISCKSRGRASRQYRKGAHYDEHHAYALMCAGLRLKEAAHSPHALPTTMPTAIRMFLLSADQFCARGKADACIASAAAACELDPYNPDATAHLARALQMSGRILDAARMATRFERLNDRRSALAGND